MPTNRTNAYQVITDRILAILAEGTIPWHKPWAGHEGGPQNIAGRPYRGINVFMLACQGYESPYWLTFNQARERGGHVRKGERSTPVVLWKPIARTETDAETGEETERAAMVLRYYRVFNASQCELPEGAVPVIERGEAFEPIEACERIVCAFRDAPTLQVGGSRAFYRPSSDSVTMPERAAFERAEGYYATLFHELGHATGHASRLNRKTLTDLCPFGSTNYSREELVAEMAAAFLCGRAGIEPATINDSAAYIAGWLRKLGDDPRMVVIAAAQAQRTSDWILG